MNWHLVTVIREPDFIKLQFLQFRCRVLFDLDNRWTLCGTREGENAKYVSWLRRLWGNQQIYWILAVRSPLSLRNEPIQCILGWRRTTEQLLGKLISLLKGSAIFPNPSADLPFWCKKRWKRLLILDQLHTNDFHQTRHFHHPGGLKNHLSQSWEMLVTESQNYSGWKELWEVPSPTSQSSQLSRQPEWSGVIYLCKLVTSGGGFGFAATLPACLSNELIHLPPS